MLGVAPLLAGGSPPAQPWLQQAFSPANIPNYAYGFDAAYNVVGPVSTAFAGAGTVGISSGTATFSSSQDGVLVVGAIVTVGANPHTVTARTDGTHWTVTGGDEGAGSAFTVTLPNPRVTQINDLAGYVSGRNFAQATASAQPTWSLINGQYAIVTNGITQKLDASAPVLTVLQNVPGLTCFLVVQAVGAYVDGAAVFFVRVGSGGALTARLVVRQVAAGSLWEVGTRRLDADSISTLDATVSSGAAWCVLCCTVDYLTGAQRIYLNGALAGSNTASWTAGGNTSNTPSLTTTIGNANTANFCACNLRGIYLWPRVVSDAERAYLTRGFGKQYAIAVSA